MREQGVRVFGFIRGEELIGVHLNHMGQHCQIPVTREGVAQLHRDEAVLGGEAPAEERQLFESPMRFGALGRGGDDDRCEAEVSAGLGTDRDDGPFLYDLLIGA